MKLRNYAYFFALVLLFTGVESVKAQKKPTLRSAQLPVNQMQQEEAIQGFREEFIKASEESKASLQKLLTLYEKDVTRFTEQSAKLKELYADGVISRQEYEKTTVNITEAQAKVDDLRKQIATTDIAIAEARRPSQPYGLEDTQMAGFSHTSWTTGNVRIDALIRANGARYRVDPYLIYCVIRQESSFGSTALSVKGAQGLMQLMPGTAARYGVMNANDPAQNISGGTRYLRDLMQLFHGRIDLVLAGYNAGEGAVLKYGQTVPPYKETQDYVHLISQRYLRKPSPAPTPDNPQSQ
jgi:soluble lytic murein transglycosylase-like protein